MELAGVVLSALSLAALFQTCFEVYDKISTLSRYEADLQDANIKLTIERHILKITKEKLEAIHLEGQADILVSVVLTRIKSLLEEIEKIINKNVPPAEIPVVTLKPGERAMKFVSRRSFKRVKWIAGDNALLTEKLALLSYFTNAVSILAMSEAERTGSNYLVRLTAISSEDDAQLTAVEQACCSKHPDIAQAARVKHLLLNPVQEIPPSNPSGALGQHGLAIKNISWADEGGLNHVISKEWVLGTLHENSWNAHWNIKGGQSTVPIIVEWRGRFMSPRSSTPITSRLDGLHGLLKAMYRSRTVSEMDGTPNQPFTVARDVGYGTLECLGWTRTSESYERIGLVFRYPYPCSCKPQSLKEMIVENRRRSPPYIPDLGSRFDLAFNATSAVANILAVGWVHRAIKSSNIINFNTAEISQMYLIGLTYAREDNASAEFSNLPFRTDSEFYRPPRPKHFDLLDSDIDSSDDDNAYKPTSSSVSTKPGLQGLEPIAIDMFGVGMVLLEIGLWQTVEKLAKSTGSPNAHHFLSYGIQDCLDRLLPRCGKIYHDVVKLCLKTDVWGLTAVEYELPKLLTSLRRCKA